MIKTSIVILTAMFSIFAFMNFAGKVAVCNAIKPVKDNPKSAFVYPEYCTQMPYKLVH